jgi:hypothetical protein
MMKDTNLFGEEPIIRKVRGKYVLFTADGKRRLGTHNTRKEALAQERAVQASKHKKG